MDLGRARESRQMVTGGGSRANGGASTAGRVGILAVLAFLSELAVFSLLAVTGWNFADALGLRLALAFLLPGAVIASWGRWLAPRSRVRLPQPALLVAQLGVFAVSGLLAIAAGLGPVAWLVPAAAGFIFGIGLLLERQPGSPAADRA